MKTYDQLLCYLIIYVAYFNITVQYIPFTLTELKKKIPFGFKFTHQIFNRVKASNNGLFLTFLYLLIFVPISAFAKLLGYQAMFLNLNLRSRDGLLTGPLNESSPRLISANIISPSPVLRLNLSTTFQSYGCNFRCKAESDLIKDMLGYRINERWENLLSRCCNLSKLGKNHYYLRCFLLQTVDIHNA